MSRCSTNETDHYYTIASDHFVQHMRWQKVIYLFTQKEKLLGKVSLSFVGAHATENAIINFITALLTF